MPMTRDDLHPLSVRRPDEPTDRAGPTPAPTSTSTVLVVDDDDEVRAQVVAALAAARYRAVCARDGGDALTVLRVVRVALIVLDLAMPGMGGRELLQRKRSDPVIASMPVLVLTGHRGPVDEPSVVEVIRKPFELRELLAAVRRHVVAPSERR
jgi:CheY-like chemotaxis protein